YVNYMERKLLGRNALPGDLTFSAQLDNGVPASTAIAQITNSPEYRMATINQVFLHYLGRSAFGDPGAFASFLPVLTSGGTQEQVAALVISSQEYFNKGGNTTVQGFLNNVYQDVLQRPADSNAL